MPRIIKTAPGDCMHIIGMLSAPTSLIRYVCINCGVYWIAARIAEVTPSTVPQLCITEGSPVGGED